jgi:putative ABC transport system ATP-binding protein
MNVQTTTTKPAASPDVVGAAPSATGQPGASLLRLTDIGKVFHTDDVETHALINVHLDVQRGEFVSISGPSGSGKSTLLAILGLLDVATHGEYRLGGEDTRGLDAARRAALRNKSIGFIFQAFNLIGDLTVAENVELPLTYRGMPAGVRKQKVVESLDRVGMSHRARHMPAQLSGGQQQRVAVARAVAGDPLILLADEPTGNLDSKNGDQVMALLEDLHTKGATICMVTHNPDYAAKATRVVHLFDGRIVDDRRG